MIQVAFTTTRGIVSRAIRVFTGAEVSHAMLLFTWMDKEWVIEAGWAGVIMMPARKQKDIIIEKIPLYRYKLDDLTDILDALGQNYDYGGLFGQIWVQVGKWFKLKFRNPTQNNKALFCSELIVESLLKPKKWPGAENLKASEVNPKDLREFLKR